MFNDGHWGFCIAPECSYLINLHDKVNNDKLSDSISAKLNNHSTSQITKESVDTKEKNNGRPSLTHVWRRGHQSKYNKIKPLSFCDYRNSGDQQASPQSVTRIPRYRSGQYVSTPQFSSPNRYQDDSPINYLSAMINLATLSTYEQRRQGHVLHFPNGHVGSPVDGRRELLYIDEARAHLSQGNLNRK
ncbi:hypothetical protein GJ496_007432 [Pomphorhynchus laevis]|nr:hypothetical protein GJ496_007432 [Pomphorhynchus laevis]